MYMLPWTFCFITYLSILLAIHQSISSIFLWFPCKLQTSKSFTPQSFNMCINQPEFNICLWFFLKLNLHRESHSCGFPAELETLQGQYEEDPQDWNGSITLTSLSEWLWRRSPHQPAIPASIEQKAELAKKSQARPRLGQESHPSRLVPSDSLERAGSCPAYKCTQEGGPRVAGEVSCFQRPSQLETHQAA